VSFSRCVDNPQFKSKRFSETAMRLYNALYASRCPLPGGGVATETPHLSTARRR